MEKGQFADIAILEETPVRRFLWINRNQILIEILDRNNPKGGFSLEL
jgi:hypothetical protein